MIPNVQVKQAQAPARARTAPLSSGIARWLLRTSPLPAVRLARADWLAILAVFVLSRLLILALGVLATALFPAMGAHQSFALQPLSTQGGWTRLFAHFDSGWYLGISHSYPLPSSGDPNWLAQWAFFPLYPVLLHPVALGLAALHLSLDVDVLAGVLVSYAAFFGGLVYLYRLVAAEVSLPAARRTIYYLAIFPAAIYFSAVYPESLFLLLTVGAFYHTRRRHWRLPACSPLGRCSRGHRASSCWCRLRWNSWRRGEQRGPQAQAGLDAGGWTGCGWVCRWQRWADMRSTAMPRPATG